MIIVPAPLEKEKDVLIRDIDRLSPYFSRFQIDIGDGVFVNNTTVRIDDFVSSFDDIKNVNDSIFDFHLMVKDPQSYIKEIQKLPKNNVGKIFIHKAAFSNPGTSSFCLVVSPEDEIRELSDDIISSLPAIQIMTVYPGFQGRPILLEMLTKIEQLRKRGFEGEILIDGGVNRETIPSILKQKYLPDVLCVGSFLTKSPQEELLGRIASIKTIIGSMEQNVKENWDE